jgi:6-phosphogluconolactonase
MKTETLWQTLPTADAVAETACRLILDTANAAIADRGRFKLVLAGGTTPEKVYRLLAKANADWQNWWIYHGDERCLPVNHKDRNSLMAAQAFLDEVAIPKEQIFDIHAELGPEQGAAMYREIVAAALPFDLVLLGMGEDGHTASLFPGHRNNPDDLTHAVYHSPKPPSERVSMSAKALSRSAKVVFLITGANKQDAVKLWKASKPLPVALVKGDDTLVICDQPALGD